MFTRNETKISFQPFFFLKTKEQHGEFLTNLISICSEAFLTSLASSSTTFVKKANSNPISISSIRALFHTNWIHAESRKSFPRQKRNYPQRIGNDVPKPCSLLAYYKVIRDEIQFNVTTSVQNDRKICCRLLFLFYHLYACVFLFIQRLPIYQSFPCFYGW